MPHGHHIYATASDMDIDIMCAYPPSQNALPQWKCVLRCCSNLLHIDLTDQESERHYYNASNSISFHIYHLISQCKVHGRHLLHEKKICCLCLQDTATTTPEKLYTRKDIIMMETSIADFHTSLYILAMKKLAFHLPHVHILGTNNCGNTRREEFKRRRENQDVLCRHGYAERVVAISAQQIQSEYYGGNIYVSIEGIALDNFSEPTHT